MAYFPPTGSVVTYQTVPSSNLGGVSIFGQLPAGTAPIGSVAALQGTNPWLVSFGNSSILAGQTGTRVSSLVSTVPSSVLVGASIFGQLPAGTAPLGSVAALQGTNPWVMTGSVQGFPTNQNVSGSVVSFPGTNPWPVVNVGSIISLNIGSVITVLQSPSIVGTYAEDAGHTTADKGLFTLGIRNDAVASFVGADLEYVGSARDSAGRTIIKPFAADDSATFRFTTSVVSGSVTLIKASATGLRNYITDFWFVNSGSVATLVTFQDGSTSVVGYAVAPAGTGANSPGINVPLRTAPSQDLAFKQAPSASILYVTVTGYQAP